MRKAKGLSANQVAIDAGISRNYMSILELGKQPPTDSVLEKLAPVLELPLEDLKREALRDRLDDQELAAAADIVREREMPSDLPPDQAAEQLAEKGREWITFHQRAKPMAPDEEDKFWEAWMAIAEAELKLRREKRGKP